MRHRVKGYKLGRTASHRRATLRALATALIRHKKIKTTVAKAKATKMFVEPLITRAKNDTVHNRRLVAAEIHDKEVLKELFGEVAEKVANRQGGYTRVVRLGQRPGDGAEMAILELVDYNIGEDVKPKAARKEKEEVKEETVEVTETAETAEVNEEVSETAENEEAAEEKSEEVSEEKTEENEEKKEE
jgi:large subunit ribosomal protein L17